MKISFVLLAVAIIATRAQESVVNKSKNSEIPTSDQNFSDVDDKVIAGQDVPTPEYFPYQVSLQQTGQNGQVMRFCGGTIIHEKYIMTAAHCVHSNLNNQVFLNNFYVNAGVTNAHCYTGSSQVRKVRRVICHERYEPNLITNDVALLELEQPFVLNQYVNWALLPEQGYQPSGNGVITGWGKTGDVNKDACSILQVGEVPITLFNVCQQNFWRNLNNDNICVGHPGTTASACPGDSGGPLAQNLNAGRAVVVGICSFGLKDKCQQYPVAYVNVAYHRNWINLQMQRAGILPHP